MWIYASAQEPGFKDQAATGLSASHIQGNCCYHLYISLLKTFSHARPVSSVLLKISDYCSVYIKIVIKTDYGVITIKVECIIYYNI